MFYVKGMRMSIDRKIVALLLVGATWVVVFSVVISYLVAVMISDSKPESLQSGYLTHHSNAKYAVTCPNCRYGFWVYAPGVSGGLKVGELGEVKK